ncbi:MAG: methyltransferase [Candidatus Krumholzibacteriia bacterium]
MTGSDRPRIDALMTGYQDSAILLTAGALGVLAALGDPQRPGHPGPGRTAVELARARQLDPRALEVLLLALVPAGVLERGDDGRFRLREDVAPLVLPDGEGSMAAILEHNFHLMKRWAHLDSVVRTGEPVPREEGKRPPEELRAFILGMKDISIRSSAEVADVVDLSGGLRLLDVGGGPGTASITFARRFPDLHCVVFDLPEVVPIARDEIAAAGLEHRIDVVAGDFHTDRLGHGFDVVYLSNIIHSLSPAETGKLFAHAAHALNDGGRIVVKDFFLDDSRTEPAQAARFAVNMLVGTREGKSYTWTETRMVLEAVGFGDLAEHRVARASGLLVGRKTG